MKTEDEEQVHQELCMPASDGTFIPTLNCMGYMTTKLDPFSIQFVDFATECLNDKGSCVLLDIGAAYGVATIPAIKAGATVYANDIDGRHLDILESQLSDEEKPRLVKAPGSFPECLEFANDLFDAILICRVLHFFTGERIETALIKCRQWLKPNGKIFIVAETPFLKNWSEFIPEYCIRKLNDETWPGLILEPSKYETNRSKRLPPLLHWLDPEVLTRELEKEQYVVEKVEFINRKDQFPDDMIYDGRESVGAIGVRRISY